MRTTHLAIAAIAGLALLAAAAARQVTPGPPTETRSPAEPGAEDARPIKVFILMGQSNMVGMGDIGTEEAKGSLLHLTRAEGRYPFLVAADRAWATRDDAHYHDARTNRGAPLGALANNGRAIGPELGFGFAVADHLDEPVLILKSCIGNRSLGWDLLPPGSDRFEHGGRTYAGYRDTPDWWIEGEEKRVVDWYAGKQYDADLANAKAALARIGEIVPAAWRKEGAPPRFEIAGFVWWQGHKDQNDAHAGRYEANLARLVHQLRKDYDAPDAPFVLATIGFGGWRLDGPGRTVAEAQLAIADPARHPEFVGTVRCVESRDLWRDAESSPRNQGHHYNRNAETYLEVGLALGRAMVELIQSKATVDASMR